VGGKRKTSEKERGRKRIREDRSTGDKKSTEIMVTIVGKATEFGKERRCFLRSDTENKSIREE